VAFFLKSQLAGNHRAAGVAYDRVEMSRAPLFRTLVGAIVISGMGLVSAQDAAKPAAAPATPPAAAQGKDQDKAKEPEKPKTIDDLTKDFTKMEGLVTLYRQYKDKKDTVYMEIPEDRFGKLMLIQITSASGLGDTSAGFVFHGMPIADLPVRFYRVNEDRVELHQPNLAHRGNTAESQLGIKRTFPDTVLGSFDVVAKQPDRRSILIDVSSFFKSDVGDLSTAVDPFGLDPSGTRIDSVKDFPENFVVRTVYQLARRGPANGDPKTTQWAVSFNISDLPENDGYKPRLGDPRVGYFTTDFEDLTDARQEFDANTSYILRWNLQKKDPSAALSEPVKPIVFYIDNAVPKEYRDDVRKGILMYNAAFEKVGIKDAIVVKQMPDDADWDIADLRYNVVRWTTGMPFAIALFRANPLTGEILNACVNFDAGFAASGSSQFDNIIDPSVSHIEMPGQVDTGSKLPASVLRKYGPMLCDMQAEGKTVQAIGYEAAETLIPGYTAEDRKRLIDQYITEVAGHEVGHCMGLRHNFAASTQLTETQLGDESLVGKYGIGASIMDYNPFNASAVGHRDVDFYSQTIGTYDFWAIQYGYTPINAATPEDEISTLHTIASLGSTPGHLYESDGSADDIDPYVIRFDSSRQPLDYLEKMVNFGPMIRAGAHKKIKNGESYYPFTRAFMAGMSAQVNNSLAAAKFVGGGRLMTSFHGDPNEQPGYRPLDASVQRRALNLMTKGLFSENSFNLDKKDLGYLTFNPKSNNNEVFGRSRMFPLQQSLVAAQSIGLATLFSSDRLNRMKGNEYRVGKAGNTLSVAELFHTMDRTVWSEVDAGKPVSDLRRELQRSYLDIMIPMALGQMRGAPNDARDLAMDQLVSLKHRIAVDLPKAKDDYTGPHLRECLGRINRALSAQTTVGVGQ